MTSATARLEELQTALTDAQTDLRYWQQRAEMWRELSFRLLHRLNAAHRREQRSWWKP